MNSFQNNSGFRTFRLSGAAIALFGIALTCATDRAWAQSEANVTITEFSVEEIVKQADDQDSNLLKAPSFQDVPDDDVTLEDLETTPAGQIDLLATIEDNATATDEMAGENAVSETGITSIDEAIESVVAPDSTAEAGPTQSDGTPGESTQNDAATAVAETADGDISAGVASTGTAGTTTADTDQGTDQGSVSLVRKEAPVSGVADIGLELQQGSRLNQLIWRGTTGMAALKLLDADYAMGASPAIASLAHDIVALRAVPPRPLDGSEAAYLRQRMEWLGAAGLSNDLITLVERLPDDDEWLSWKRWLVENQLMTRRDEAACRSVMLFASRTLEAFWHKAKVICNAVQGESMAAQFAADLLAASGETDPVFSALVNKMLNDIEPDQLDPALLEPIHIVLMDAAHFPVDAASLEALPPATLQSAIGMRYVAGDARLILTHQALAHGLVDAMTAAKLWRLAEVQIDGPMLALARHESMPTAQTRALVWRALDAEKTARRLPMIAAAMDVDIASGVGDMMAPLYATLIREGLSFPGAGEMLGAADSPTATKLALILVAADLTATDSMGLPAQLAGTTGRAAAELGLTIDAPPTKLQFFDDLAAWHLLPLIEAATGVAVTPPEGGWLAWDSPAGDRKADFVSLPPLMLLASEEAADGARVAEAVLLLQRLVSDIDLATLNPADAARMVAILDSVGQPEVARRFTAEILSSHLLAMASTIDAADDITALMKNEASGGPAKATDESTGGGDALSDEAAEASEAAAETDGGQEQVVDQDNATSG